MSPDFQICVVDTGPGIPTDQQAQIFEEFIQLANPERDRNKGLGLGLAIVRRLAQLLDHRLIVRSQLGRGSLFAIEVPLGISTNEIKDMPVSEASPLKQSERKFIIIIDDDNLVLEALKILLKGWGHSVLTAGSGAALRNNMTACTKSPDLIISDYRLPNGDNGIEVIEQTRNEFNEDIPAVLLTGDTAPENLLEAKAHGLQLIHKPLDAQKLRDLIDTL